MIDKRRVLARGVMSTAAAATAPNPPTFITQPGSGATITLWDSTTDSTSPIAARRIFLMIYSSHASAASGVSIEHSCDAGVNWDFTETYTLSATTATVYNVHVRSPWVRIKFTNSAATVTAWRFCVVADEFSADPGV